MQQREQQSGATISMGMHERHLRRKDNNPLFALPAKNYPAEALLQAREQDNREFKQFHADMQSVIEQAINLEQNVQSEVILELRGKLDALYVRCSSFGAQCREHKQNIRKLIDLVMKAVWQAAGSDPQARKELEQEELARQQHLRLLEYPLVADLIRPDTPIGADDIVPTLLHASSDELEAVLWLFEPDQLRQLCTVGEALLRGCREAGEDLKLPWVRLQMMQEHLSTP